MRLPSGYSTYDYSVTPKQKGWGEGWPSCTAGPVSTITLTRSRTVITNVHARVATLLALIMNEIERRGFLFYNPGTWGGACRVISGTTVSSNHAWKLACDMNAPDNPYTYSGKRTIPDWAFAVFRAYGWGLGADYVGKKDWMHAEFMGTPQDADIMTALAVANFGGVYTSTGDDMFTDNDRLMLVRVHDRLASLDAGLSSINGGPGMEPLRTVVNDMRAQVQRTEAAALATQKAVEAKS